MEGLAELDYFARRVYDLVEWHSELYLDAKNLPEIRPTIEQLPAVSIGYLGLSEAGLPHLLTLIERGVRVKATGFRRVQLHVANALQEIYKVNPDELMFGTDLPSTRAKHPFTKDDIETIRELFDEHATEKIMYKNAYEWYRI